MKQFYEQLKWLPKIIYFDNNDYLREKATDPKLLQELIDEAVRELGQTTNDDDRYFLFGTLGNLYRVKEQPIQAIQYLNQALELVVPNSTEEIVTHIRLGEAYKYYGEHNQALQFFEEALLKCYEYEPAYLDFAFQHKGKCLVRNGTISGSHGILPGCTCNSEK